MFWLLSKNSPNKTTGQHRPLTLLKIPFRRKAFSRKVLFSKFIIFWFLQKETFNFRCGKHFFFMKKCHLIRILQQFCHLYRFWKNSRRFFQKTTQISYVLRNLTISVAFYSKFSTICRTKNKWTEPSNIEHCNTGHYQLEMKRKNTFALGGWFSSHI